jgi:hypothetical protein
MIAGRPPDYRDVVHPVRLQTRVVIAAGTPPCITLRDQAAHPRGRDYHTVRLGNLEDLALPERWVLAAILCPGDTTESLVAWLQKTGGDPDRVLVVVHPQTDSVAALRAWYAAGYNDPLVVEAQRLRDFAADLGRFVNDWIYVDATGSGWPL